MAILTNIFIVVKKENLPSTVNTLLGGSIAYTDFSGKNYILGTVAAAQATEKIAPIGKI